MSELPQRVSCDSEQTRVALPWCSVLGGMWTHECCAQACLGAEHGPTCRAGSRAALALSTPAVRLAAAITVPFSSLLTPSLIQTPVVLTKLVLRSYVKPWWVWISQAHLSRQASAFGWASSRETAEESSVVWLQRGHCGRRQLLSCGVLPGLGVCATSGGVNKWLLEVNLLLHAKCGVWGVCRENWFCSKSPLL